MQDLSTKLIQTLQVPSENNLMKDTIAVVDRTDSNNGSKTTKKTKKPNTPRKYKVIYCLLYTSPSPRDRTRSRMPSSA